MHRTLSDPNSKTETHFFHIPHIRMHKGLMIFRLIKTNWYPLKEETK